MQCNMTSQRQIHRAPGSVSFISWNIRGMGNTVKRNKIFCHLRSFDPDIIFLQETHLKVNSHTRLRNSWIGQVYHSNFNHNSRGVAILFRKGVQFSHTKTIQDPSGKFIILIGKLYKSPIILVNIYGPNWDDPQFFTKVISSLTDVDTHQLIIAGDLNCVLHPQLDRSNPKPGSQLSKSGGVLDSFMHSYNLADPWRKLNPDSKQFSFFSPVHKSYSRIDYFLINNNLLPYVTNSQYHSIVVSDHSPVQLDIHFPENVRPRRTCRLDPSLLLCPEFKTFVAGQIDLFFEINDCPDISRCTLWESHKAYIRGQIISYTAHKNKEHNKRLVEIEQSIADIDKKCSAHSTSELHKERILLQMEYNNLSTHKVVSNLLKTKQKFYEHGEKAGRMLAHQLRQSTSNSQIPEINIAPGVTTSDPNLINCQFKKYYSNLYLSDADTNPAKIQSFLDSLDAPTLNPDIQSSLDQPFTANEIQTAINSMQSGRTPGPDGYPIEYYKTFSSRLVPLLKSMYDETLEAGCLPPTLTQATISLILKKDKNPLDCSSYRPISLLCCDYTILTKALANRLNDVIPTLIHQDQTGFIPGQQPFFNLRRLFNVMYSTHSTQQPEVILSLNAEKAFDRIEWEYLHAVMKKFGFGETFRNWIKILYSCPMSAVKTNQHQHISHYIKARVRAAVCHHFCLT
uniref:Reverse transcriptase domain-containing protein n=1 Tax=Dicentrarchus labrax TaxID=13489 RepID=A0A8P4G9K3_DICLA